jgi:hypothetical protein
MTENLRDPDGRDLNGTSTCPKCGEYMPLTLDETRRIHHCHRTPPIDLPHGICVCPVCGGYAPFRAGCWGTKEDPHPHAYMRPIHEVVCGVAAERARQGCLPESITREERWWRSILRDVDYALRNQDYLPREDIAEAIDRALNEGVPDA